MTTANDSSSATERTPLVRGLSVEEQEQQAHDLVYDRFTPKRKRTIVAMCAWGSVVPFLVSGSFVPAIPQIAADLNSTPSKAALSVTLSILGNAIGNLLWATYCGYYGRRPIFLFSLPTLFIASLGVASARSVPSLLVWRLLQAFGCSSGMSVGASVIGDIYKMEERGTAMGVFFGASLVGPAVAPLIGGLATHYASWRTLQLVFCGLSASAFLLMYTQLPETSHPGTRGVDRALKAERVVAGVGDEDDYPQKWKWVWLNPFASLALLRAPNILAVAVAGSFALLTDFIMFVPSMYTFGKQYRIKNEAYVGLLFLSIGLGNMIGAPVAGRLSDWMVVRWRKRRGGVWVPEDRLRATLVGAGVFAPLSVLLSGIFTRFVPAPLGIILNVAVLFINGVGVDMTLAPSSAYFVDILHSRSAEVISATNSLRAIFLTVITSGAIPAVERFGIVITNTTSAIVAWIGFALLLLTIRYGDRMRASTSIEWTTHKDN